MKYYRIKLVLRLIVFASFSLIPFVLVLASLFHFTSAIASGKFDGLLETSVVMVCSLIALFITGRVLRAGGLGFDNTQIIVPHPLLCWLGIGQKTLNVEDISRYGMGSVRVRVDVSSRASIVLVETKDGIKYRIPIGFYESTNQIYDEFVSRLGQPLALDDQHGKVVFPENPVLYTGPDQFLVFDNESNLELEQMQAEAAKSVESGKAMMLIWNAANNDEYKVPPGIQSRTNIKRFAARPNMAQTTVAILGATNVWTFVNPVVDQFIENAIDNALNLQES